MNSAKVSPSQYRALVIKGRGKGEGGSGKREAGTGNRKRETGNGKRFSGLLLLADHVDVNDSIFLVRRRYRIETKFNVEPLEPSLRCDLDRLTGRETIETSQSFSHQRLPQACSASLRRGDDSSNRGLGVSHSWLEYSSVGDESPPLRGFSPAEQVPRVRIASIGILIGALLLDHEDFFAQTNRSIEIVGPELAEPRPLPEWSRFRWRRFCALRVGRACPGQVAPVF